MINRLIDLSVQNRAVVLFLAAALMIGGAQIGRNMDIDVFPDISAPTVTVVTESRGMAPEEVETLVTLPIETALNGAPGMRRLRSSSAAGISVIWAEFSWGTDIYRARQIVNERIQAVQGSLPKEIEPPILAPISSVMGEIQFLALRSDTHSSLELRTTAEWNIRRRILSLPGIAQVVMIGGDEKQYQVRLDPRRLEAHGLTWREVEEALASSNRNASAGYYLEGGQEYLIRGIGRVQSAEDIRGTVVAFRRGVPIRVGEVAHVAVGAALKRGTAAFRGEPAVVFSIQKQPDANTLDLTRRLDALLDEISPGLPEGMVLERDIFRQADFINVAVGNVLEALRDGSLLVVLILALFLASARATFITVLALPLSLLTAVLALKWAGATINTMTLGGMAIAIGDIVDDAIVDVENVFRRLRENARLPENRRRPVMDVVVSASREIRSSIVFATLIILTAFAPLFFLPGIEGRLLKPLGFAYVTALFSSLVVAVTVTPALCFLLLPRSRAVLRPEETRLMSTVRKFYRPILNGSMDHPRAVASTAAGLMLCAFIALPFFGRSFLPAFNEGTLTIGATTVAGISLEESDRLAGRIDRALAGFPEVRNFARRTGRAERDEHAQGVERSEWEVTLTDEGHRRAAFLAELRHVFSQISGYDVEIGQPISHRIDHMLSGARANLAVKIFGENLQVLRRVGTQVKEAMAGVPGVVDLILLQQPDIPILQVKFNRDALARYGLAARDVAETLEAAFFGRVVSRVLEGAVSFDLVLRADISPEDDVRRVETLLLDGAQGVKIPLRLAADVTRTGGPYLIDRENLHRKAVVSCNVSGRDLQSVVDDIRTKVSKLSLPRGVWIEYGGQFEAQEQAGRRLLWLGAAAMLAITILLYSAFGVGRDVMFILFSLPFSLIGGVAGVYVSGGIISIATLVGFVALFGIATRSGILLISHIRHLKESEGVADFREAVERGAMERLRPILMTALATSLALLPLALGGGEPGREIQTPMAIVILCGLVTSTILNLLVIPPLYFRFGSRRQIEN